MSLPVELPALYLDNITGPTDVGITIANTIPEADSLNAPVDTDIQLDVISTDSESVDKDNTDVYVNGALAVSSGVPQAGFDGPNAIVEMLSIPSAAILADGDAEYKGTALFTDGDMEAVGVAAWTVGNNAALTKTAGNPGGSGAQVLHVAHQTIFGPYASEVILTIGKTYRVVGWARGNGGAYYPTIEDGAVARVWQGTASATWQTFDFTFIAQTTELRLRGNISAPGGWVEFDDVFVSEDCPDWTVHNSALLSKEPGSPGGSGSQVLRVTYNGTPPAYASQAVLTNGKTYHVTGWARGDGASCNPVITDDGSGIVWTGTTSATWQPVDISGVSGGTLFVLLNGGGVAGYVEFDDLALTEVHDLRVIIDPTTDFSSEETVTVRVVSQTIGGTYTLDDSYSFTCADIVQPYLVSAEATGPFTIRVTFSEGMLASSETGANDALNPDNYTFEYQPESDRIAAVAVYASSVEQVSATVYDVTVDMEPTFNKTYELTCGDIDDDSGNELEANQRTADFTSWHPPYWPARRSFDLWSQLSDDDRASDEEVGDLRRMISAMQDVVDIMLWDIDAEQFYHDIDKAPEWAIDAMLADMGNPFALNLTLERKRKLLGVLVDIYREKGTDEGIVDVARFFLGIEITSVTEINIDTWILGESELGVDTDLGPSGDAEPYTFWLNVDEALSDDDRRDLEALVEYMKPAHTHYLIIEPADPAFVDHVELGLSELGVSWTLH